MKVRSRVNIILSIGFLVFEVDAVGNSYFFYLQEKRTVNREEL